MYLFDSHLWAPSEYTWSLDLKNTCFLISDRIPPSSPCWLLNPHAQVWPLLTLSSSHLAGAWPTTPSARHTITVRPQQYTRANTRLFVFCKRLKMQKDLNSETINHGIKRDIQRLNGPHVYQCGDRGWDHPPAGTEATLRHLFSTRIFKAI